jgi:ATP-dependent Clp protease ATP-binding subunit ClpC
VIEHFSADARRALAASEREAKLLRHRQVGTEHVLLGLLRVEDAVAARALRLLGVTYRKARRRIVRLVDVGGEAVDGRVSFTPRVREILEDAYSGSNWVPLVVATSLDRAAPPTERATAPRLRMPGPRPVQTEELLLALLAHGEGVAAAVLESFGVDLEKLAVACNRARLGDLPPLIVGGPPSWPPSL